MARRGGFGHLGAGGHEGVVEELAVIARVADHVDDAHGFFLVVLLLIGIFVRFGWRNGKIWIRATLLDIWSSTTTFGG